MESAGSSPRAQRGHGDGRPHEIARELVKPVGIGGIDGREGLAGGQVRALRD